MRVVFVGHYCSFVFSFPKLNCILQHSSFRVLNFDSMSEYFITVSFFYPGLYIYLAGFLLGRIQQYGA